MLDGGSDTESLDAAFTLWMPVLNCFTQVQCIMHFLQLPIEDPFLDEMEMGGPGTSSTHLPPGVLFICGTGSTSCTTYSQPLLLRMSEAPEPA